MENGVSMRDRGEELARGFHQGRRGGARAGWLLGTWVELSIRQWSESEGRMGMQLCFSLCFALPSCSHPQSSQIDSGQEKQ